MLIRIEFMWEKLKIPLKDRDLIRKFYSNSDEISKNTQIITEYSQMLTQFYEETNKITSLISTRETYLQVLKTAVLGGVRLSRAGEEIVPKLVEIRQLTGEIVEGIQAWRRYLSLPSPFVYCNMNYVVKIKADTEFLAACPVFRVLKKYYLSDLVFFIPLDNPIRDGNFSHLEDQRYRALCRLLKPASPTPFQACVQLLNTEDHAISSLSQYSDAPWFAWSITSA